MQSIDTAPMAMAPEQGGGAGGKTYEGRRTMDGLVVTVDDAPLSEHAEVREFTPYGFEWSYEGEAPQQLALAILMDFTGDAEKAVALSDAFMRKVVANLDNDWTLTGAEIAAALDEIAR